MNRFLPTACVLALLLSGSARADDPPPFKPDDFPPTTAPLKLAIKVGDRVTIGGPGSANFLPNEGMDVYIVPHRAGWREGDPLGANAVKKARVRSNKDGELLLTDVWTADRVGAFDIIVDYDGNGKWSFSLDTVDGISVRPQVVTPSLPRSEAPKP
jgi:hypothetical protein